MVGLYKIWCIFCDDMYKRHEKFFGRIRIDDKIETEKTYETLLTLNECGNIVEQEWLKTGELRKNVLLDEYVVMPNHFHGIIMLNNESVETTRRVVSQNAVNCKETTKRDVSPNNKKLGNPNKTTHRVVSTGLKPNSLGSIIGQFKSICTKRIHEIGYSDFYWQERFYDHIIKDEKALNIIREYIFNNPLKWKYDKYYRR